MEVPGGRITHRGITAETFEMIGRVFVHLGCLRGYAVSAEPPRLEFSYPAGTTPDRALLVRQNLHRVLVAIGEQSLQQEGAFNPQRYAVGGFSPTYTWGIVAGPLVTRAVVELAQSNHREHIVWDFQPEREVLTFTLVSMRGDLPDDLISHTMAGVMKCLVDVHADDGEMGAITLAPL